MNELKIFENPEFGKVRMMVINNEPYFVGKDVAEMLGYTNTNKALSDHCKGVTKCYIPHPQGNSTLEVNIIPERDVYRLIMRSKLPSAERFEEWVVGEVLPAIRKTGSYSQPKPVELPKPRRSILEVQSLDFGDDMELRIMKMVGDYADIEVLIGYAIVDMAVKRGLYTADLAATCLNKGMEAYVHTR